MDQSVNQEEAPLALPKGAYETFSRCCRLRHFADGWQCFQLWRLGQGHHRGP